MSRRKIASNWLSPLGNFPQNKKSIRREGLRIISNLILTKGFLNYFCLSLHCKQSKYQRFATRKNNPVSLSFWIAITNLYNKQWKCTPHNSRSRVQIKIPADPVPNESWFSGSQRLSMFLLYYHTREGSKDIFMGIF